MLPVLLLLTIVPLTSHGSPIPETDFIAEVGLRALQTKVPTFGGMEWAKSRGGVCYDSESDQKVIVGQQFFLDCSRCTCDRYGFWCVPKCPVYWNRDLDNCLVVQETGDKCCPTVTCLQYKNELFMNQVDDETDAFSTEETTTAGQAESTSTPLYTDSNPEPTEEIDEETASPSYDEESEYTTLYPDPTDTEAYESPSESLDYTTESPSGF